MINLFLKNPTIREAKVNVTDWKGPVKEEKLVLTKDHVLGDYSFLGD